MRSNIIQKKLINSSIEDIHNVVWENRDVMQLLKSGKYIEKLNDNDKFDLQLRIQTQLGKLHNSITSCNK
jgi:hypothetical protein